MLKTEHFVCINDISQGKEGGFSAATYGLRQVNMFEVLPFVWDSASFKLAMPQAIASCKDSSIFEDIYHMYKNTCV